MDCEKVIVVFQDSKIRRMWKEGEWYFSIVDVIKALTNSSLPKRYWSDLKIKLGDEGFESYDKIVQLKLIASDGKKYKTDCANTKSMFRIIQSIPSKKAEPFKQWLAQVGYERIKEIENPELAQERMKKIYEQKGYSVEWIKKRLRGIVVRQELTDEWRNRKVNEGKEFAILTSEISKATFGKTINEYKDFKKLKKESLRDHMDDLELILTMLGEASTTVLTRKFDSEKLKDCKKTARIGGKIAGNARKDLEKELDESIVKPNNYLKVPEKIQRKKLKKKKVKYIT